ncbi:MAG: hypothetical protein RLZZ01_639 [Actinomycetota bacterium]
MRIAGVVHDDHDDDNHDDDHHDDDHHDDDHSADVHHDDAAGDLDKRGDGTQHVLEFIDLDLGGGRIIDVHHDDGHDRGQ